MSDTTHLLIPYAASASEGCQQALQGLALPHLDRLVARLSPHPAHSDSGGEETSFSAPHERALARALGLPAQDGRIPWAAWHRHQQGLPASGDAWAFVTPCQWQVSTDHVTLRNPEHLALDEAASRALLAIVTPWFAEDGITLHYDQPTRWLASSPLFADLATASLERVLQRDVRAWMPDAKAARTLHRLHSEMQMLLYTHAFNDARSERGLPVINSFWVHGTGTMPTPAPATFPAPVMPTPLRDAALNEDWRTWAAAWTALDAGPVADLLRQAEGGTPVQLTLCGERNTLAFHTAPRTLAQRFQSLFRPQRFTEMRNQL
ncbi:MAG: phosphoglycerate mutase [Gammaproteobacteria bacterium]|nr:phosphoglycerate mutase [Gammaproteobacteria bacterium]MBU1504670.1 phosphoglycerate mutase [Gammaproteobacteria bacterium]MBU2122619.1 phosphoglycerate mutase [Gammaproteobacteria bacterium]MBU2171576.1 phosphoglycerate mutase [Gammaproteobacteria bacterium]MBU2199031.1 phosphoglycerate mutase [Gammaproteobacteria bacterium]